jgi:hypothetical protein
MLSLLREAGCSIIMKTHTNFSNYSKRCFEIIVDGVTIAIDFSDHLEVSVPNNLINKYTSIFKFHYNEGIHGNYKNIHPFTPVNFQNWDLYKKVVDKINYTANGLIASRQIPYAAALERRRSLQHMLKEKYGSLFTNKVVQEELFYLSINNTLVSVCAPGARNNMLDRGQCQYMALGCCTISPNILTTLSWGKTIMPGIHYIKCKDDYSDIHEKIEWVKNNTDLSIEIGQNAKNLFGETSLPVKQVEWIKKCINND